jgi:hypothetical protein
MSGHPFEIACRCPRGIPTERVDRCRQFRSANVQARGERDDRGGSDEIAALEEARVESYQGTHEPQAACMQSFAIADEIKPGNACLCCARIASTKRWYEQLMVLGTATADENVGAYFFRSSRPR